MYINTIFWRNSVFLCSLFDATSQEVSDTRSQLINIEI